VAVREIANKVVFDYNRALEPINGTLEVRKTLVADALQYLNAQIKDADNDTHLKSEIARGFQAVGDIQGRGVTTSNLGQVAAAQQSYNQALSLREQICSASPQLRVATDSAAAVPACAALAGTMMAMADSLFASGKGAEAIEKMEAARTLNASTLAALGNQDPAHTAVLRQQFNLNHRVAGLSLRQSGAAYAKGLALAQENLPLAQALAKRPNDPLGNIILRDAQDFLGNRLLASGNAPQALQAMDAALALGQAQYQAKPTGSNAVYVMTTLSQRADIQLQLNQAQAAQADALQALTLARQTHLADPQNAQFKARYANIGRKTGALLNALEASPARASAEQLMAEVAAVSGSFTAKDGVFWHQHQGVVLQQAQAAHLQGKSKAALALLGIFPEQGFDNPRAALDMADAYALRAKVLAALQQASQAQAALNLALGPLQARAKSTPADVMNRASLADLCQWAAQQTTWPTAQAEYRECAKQNAQSLAQSNSLTPWWRVRLAPSLSS
jgi:eukaryotic-like serine/threonine-protein kinase